jgi:hypothetical protein
MVLFSAHWLLVANEKQEITRIIGPFPIVEAALGQQGGLNQAILD